MSVPRVSVIIPAYNASASIASAIESVIRGTYDDFELVVCDDASKDATRAVVEAQEDARVVLIRSPANSGPAAARNLALSHADGELVAFLDADDRWLPSFLAEQVSLFDRERQLPPPVGIVACDAWLVDATGRRVGRHSNVVGRAQGVDLTRLLLGNVIYVSALCPRSVVEQAGGFSPDCFGSEDHDLWLRILELGHRVAVNPEPLALYALGIHGISSAAATMARTDQATYRRALARSRLTPRQQLIARQKLKVATAAAAIGALHEENTPRAMLTAVRDVPPGILARTRLRALRARDRHRPRRAMGSEQFGGRPLWILDDGGAVFGGGQRFALGLASASARPVTIACPAGSPMDEAARTAHVPTVHVPFPPPSLGQIAAVLRAARRLRDVVPGDALIVSGAIRATLVARLAHLPNPVVVLMHERDSASRMSVRLALRNAPAVVVVGQAAAHAYRKALPTANVTAVNNFLSSPTLSRFLNARRPRTQHKSVRPVLAVLARLIPEKGIAELIDQLAEIPDSWDRLIIAGAHQDPAYVLAIESQIKASSVTDRIALRGAVDDVTTILQTADALLVPSTGKEGQPTVILEGLAAGATVIVRAPIGEADFQGLPVVSYRDTEELAHALASVPLPEISEDVLRHRFGASQVLQAIDQAGARQRRD